MKELIKYIKSKTNLNDTDLERILSNFQEKKINKDQFVIKKRQIMTEYCFVKSGALKIYTNNKDKLITVWVAFENEFFTDLSSLHNNTESQFHIQAIEETELLVIKKDKMNQLYQQYPQWQEFGRKVWETTFMKMSDSMISFQTMTAEERYLDIIKNNKNLINRLPVKDLASFLGITATSLSRIRKSIK